MAAQIGPKIGIDGYADYKKQIDKIVQQAKTLDSEMRVVKSSFDDETKSEEKNAKQKEVLEKQIKNQQERVKTLTEVVEKCSDMYGENDTRTLKWKEALNNAQATLNTMNKGLEEESDKLQNVGKEMDESASKSSTFRSMLEANLLSEAIKNALSKLVDLVKSVGAALKDCIVNASDFADEIITMSSVTGIGTDALQEFYYMSDLVDVSVDALKSSLKKITPVIKTYASDTEKATAAEEKAANTRNKRKKQQILDNITYSATTQVLQKLGVSALDSAGKMRSSEDVFWDIVKALQGVTDTTQRGIYAQQIFGNNYAELNPLLDQTAESLAELRNEARDSGYVMSESTLGTLGSLNDTFVRFNLLITTIKNKLGATLAPFVEKALTRISDYIKQLDWNVVAAKIEEFVYKAIAFFKDLWASLVNLYNWIKNNSAALKDIGTVFSWLGYILLGLYVVVDGCIDIVVGLWNALKKLWEIVSTLVAAFAAAISTIIYAFALLGEKVAEFCTTAASKISEWVRGTYNDVAAWARGFYDSLSNAFSSVVERVSNMFAAVKRVFSNIINAAKNWGRDFIQGFINGIVEKINALINKIKEIAAKIRSFLHFSRPDEGPLRDYEQWMPDMIKGMAASINSNAYILDNAVAGLAGRMSATMAGASATTVNMTVYGANGQSVNDLADVIMRRMYQSVKAKEYSR